MLRIELLEVEILSSLDLLFDKILKQKKKLDFRDFLDLKRVDLSEHAVIGNFICNNEDLRKELVATEKIIDSYFKKPERKRPLNILISAPPGSGKSFLLKQFVTKLDTVYQEYNLSTLIDKKEVFSVFRFIEQENEKGITPIIFIDEVDTAVNEEYIFPYFISAMSDGKSSQSTQVIKCCSAIIAFAGSGLFESSEMDDSWSLTRYGASTLSKAVGLITKIVDKVKYEHTYYKWRDEKIESLKTNSSKINKFKDFLDRIDLFIMLPPTSLELRNYSLKWELIDLSVSLIRKHISVSEVELHYLLVIMTLVYSFNSKREAESVVFVTSTPKSRTLRFEDLPYSVTKNFEAKLRNIENRIIEIGL